MLTMHVIIEFSLAVRERGARESGDKNSYEELLEKSVGFRNPNNIIHLASCMGILNHKSTLMAGLRYKGVRNRRDISNPNYDLSTVCF